MKKALIIDGNNLIFKAYYATAYHGNNLHSLQAIPTNALYAFIRMINKFICENHYDALFVAFDAGKKTFRTELFKEYKATRKSTPNELLLQIDLVKEYLTLAKIPWEQEANYEADDLIGTIAKKNQKDYQISIISSDKDLYQILDDNIKILLPQKGLSDLKEFNTKDLKQEYSLTPKQIPDLKGLMGDSSDNLPGIRGIGQKTAIKLLQEYDNLENIIANIDKLPKKLATLIATNKENGILTKKLATINLQAPIKKTLKACYYDINLLKKPELQYFYKKYNMKTLITAEKKQHPLKNNKIIILEQWDPKFNAKINFLWTEVWGQNYHREPLLALAIKNEFGVFYCKKTMITNSKTFKDFLNNKKYQKITWDIKKSFIAIKNHFNINPEGFIFDHMLASYLLYANENITLENIANILQVENYEHLSDDDFYGKASKKQLPTDEIEIAKHLELKLNFLVDSYPILIEKLKSENNYHLFEKIELPAVYPLITMEINGISVDLKELEKITKNTKIALENLEKKLIEMAKKPINPNSPKQISQLLFEDLKLPKSKKNSTAYDVLVTLKNQHPIINVLLEYRKLQKLYATYLNGLKKYIFKDNKIHTIYHQEQTSTGRLSSAEPNMQNISVRDAEQKEVRKIFVPSKPNLKIVSCDYSQIELRILAHMSNDENLIKAFSEKHDIHLETASKIFNTRIDQITKEQRNKAKTVNFGIIYGISSFGLSQQLKISIAEAKAFIDKYFLAFPKIQNYIEEQINFCQTHGYVETLFNRKRSVPEIYDHNKQIKEFGQRIAINMPIQGSSADIIKIAMIKIDNAIKTKKIKANLIAQIHDELIFEIEKENLKTEISKISKIMSEVIKLKVPLIINTESGNNWYELK